MDGRRPRLGLPALGIAAGGVLVGHWLTYLIVRPDDHDRASLLATTGHGYLAVAIEVALLVGLVAAAAVFLGRLLRRDGASTMHSLASRLGVFQVVTFVVLEVVERAAVGSFEGLLTVCLAGSAVQLLVAPATAWLLRRLEQAADVAATFLGRGAPTTTGRVVARVRASIASPGGRGSPVTQSIRGPPLLP